MPIVDIYLRDRINIITVSKDINGVETESTESDIKCRIEDTNKLIKNQAGQEVVGVMKIFVTPTASIVYTNKIQITKKAGVATSTPDKKYAIEKLSKRQGFSPTGDHWEVWL